jgi:beta-glucanase (GH16 family)
MTIVKYSIFLIVLSVVFSCSSSNSVGGNGQIKNKIQTAKIIPVTVPVAGNYPQSLLKFPYKENSVIKELFTQTLTWEPEVDKTFKTDTQYTAVLTLEPVNRVDTLNGLTVDGIRGLPSEKTKQINVENVNDSVVIKITFEKTASVNAQAQIIFSEDFDGNTLDKKKWELCPEWDRQGRSSWRDDMVSVSNSMLHIKFTRDAAIGKSKSSKNEVADNWIRTGGVRTLTKNNSVLFSNTFGFYEARIKMPKINGVWGAFWLMSFTQGYYIADGSTGTEIDILETIDNRENAYNAALHWNGYEKDHKTTGSKKEDLPAVNIYDGNFHTFALDWSPKEYIFYVDGIEFWRVDGGAKFNNSGINKNPNYIKLTVESAEWAGNIPAGFTEAEMLVDYVRVYNQPQIGK